MQVELKSVLIQRWWYMPDHLLQSVRPASVTQQDPHSKAGEENLKMCYVFSHSMGGEMTKFSSSIQNDCAIHHPKENSNKFPLFHWHYSLA